jgi:hypothetical protein
MWKRFFWEFSSVGVAFLDFPLWQVRLSQNLAAEIPPTRQMITETIREPSFETIQLGS